MKTHLQPYSNELWKTVRLQQRSIHVTKHLDEKVYTPILVKREEN
jgi:hypothetical protein